MCGTPPRPALPRQAPSSCFLIKATRWFPAVIWVTDSVITLPITADHTLLEPFTPCDWISPPVSLGLVLLSSWINVSSVWEHNSHHPDCPYDEFRSISFLQGDLSCCHDFCTWEYFTEISQHSQTNLVENKCIEREIWVWCRNCRSKVSSGVLLKNIKAYLFSRNFSQSLPSYSVLPRLT
jgi:hypothetical protein